MARPVRLPEECNAIGHRGLQVCEQGDWIADDRHRGEPIEFAESASGDELCGNGALINQERAVIFPSENAWKLGKGQRVGHYGWRMLLHIRFVAGGSCGCSAGELADWLIEGA